MGRKRGSNGEIVWTAEERTGICQAFRDGKTMNALALQLKVNHLTLRKVLVAGGCNLRQNRKRKPWRRYAINERFFQTIDTEHKAYWLGFICADGHLHKGGSEVTVCLARRDAGHLDKLKLSVGSEHPIRFGISNLGHPLATIRMGCKAMQKDLQQHGVHFAIDGVSDKQFPESSLPPPLLQHYLRGLFDGDGGFSLSQQSRYGGGARDQWCMAQCGSLSCVEAFGRFAKNVCGTRANIKPHETGIWYFTVTGNCKVPMLAKALYEGATIGLDRKLDFFKLIVASPPGRVPQQIDVGGQSMTVGQWAELNGVTTYCFYERLKRGWPAEEAANLPPTPKRLMLSFKGETRTIDEWSQILGIKKSTIQMRLLCYGFTVEEALSRPVRKHTRRPRTVE